MGMPPRVCAYLLVAIAAVEKITMQALFAKLDATNDILGKSMQLEIHGF